MLALPTKILSLFGPILLISVTLQIQNANAANILGLFTSSSPSHLIVHMSVVKALAEKGHNVTVVSNLEPKITHKNIRTIVVPPTAAQEKAKAETMDTIASQKNGILTLAKNFFSSFSVMLDMQFTVVNDKSVRALYETPDTKFDLVIVGYFMNEYQLGIAAKLNCPVVLSWSGPPGAFLDTFVGNPAEISYVPAMTLATKPGEPMNFLLRLQNLFISTVFKVIHIGLEHKMHNYYSQLFPATEEFPTFEQMKKNVSLVLCNSHFSEGPIRPNVPAVIEIGGIQIKDKPDPLPKDIAEFFEASKNNGVILFSLGSNLDGSNIKPETIQILFRALSSLKQNVIWKWNDLSNTPGKSANILFKKWLPQDDILAHPKLKLFITHAGKGGLAEAQYHAVPMLALPVFADQSGNAQKMADAGYGLQLNMLELEEESLKSTLKEMLSNPIYARNIKKFSQLYRDRPQTAKETAVFWIEYVLRHHGAPHMQSPLVHMNIIQSSNLDVIAVICLVIYAVWRLLKFVFGFVYSKLCGSSKKTKSKKVKKH